MSQFKKLISHPVAKALLGLSVGVGGSYWAYQSMRQPILVKDEQLSEQKIQIQLPKVPIIVEEVKPSESVQPSEPQPVVQKKQQPSKEQEKKEQEKQPVKIEKRFFAKLKEINQLDIQNFGRQQDRVIIVADLPYNEQFEAKIMEHVNKISKLYQDIKIYRKDLTNKDVQSAFQKQNLAKVKEQTIFLVKNPYEKGLTNIDFDIFIQYPFLIEAYLKAVKLYDSESIKEVTNRLENLSPYQSALLYLYDKSEPEEKIKQRMLAAKYIQMQMALSNLSGIRLQVVDKNAAVDSLLVDPENARTNSVHLYRKHNIYTPFDPNFYLPRDKGLAIPFHRLADIALFAKGNQNLIINQYLGGLQTFDATANPAPYMCTLCVDRNKISDEDYNSLVQAFGELRRKNVFSNVSFSIKLNTVRFSGKDNPQNKEWQITLANVDEMDKQSLMHEIKTANQREKLGYKENQYLRTSHEYIYDHTEFSYDLLKEFLEKGTKGELPRFYKSEEDHPLAPIRGLAGGEFEQTILNNQGDHFVYEYSQFCPTCKRISPIIGAFAKVIQDKGMGLDNLQFHKIDANKNRVKGQLSSPYIPNIFFYKNEWKRSGPVRFPIDMLGTQGLISLFAFCSITSQLKSMDWSCIDKAIESSNAVRKEILEMI